MQVKQCSRCRKRRPLDEFLKPSGESESFSTCSSCRNAKNEKQAEIADFREANRRLKEENKRLQEENQRLRRQIEVPQHQPTSSVDPAPLLFPSQPQPASTEIVAQSFLNGDAQLTQILSGARSE